MEERKVVISIEEYDLLRENNLLLLLLKRAFEQNARLGRSGDDIVLDSDEFFAVVRAFYPNEYRMTLDRLKKEKAAEEAKKSDEE